MSKYDLKKRDYVGNTSFDAELSLITANQALVYFPVLDASHYDIGVIWHVDIRSILWNREFLICLQSFWRLHMWSFAHYVGNSANLSRI